MILPHRATSTTASDFLLEKETDPHHCWPNKEHGINREISVPTGVNAVLWVRRFGQSRQLATHRNVHSYTRNHGTDHHEGTGH
jgi:hypothetical protein